ncbi:MAG TPA: hypothetical protein VK668_19310 [Mucilaginibacter sp.]|nr:hypothetical protein [Mucilaginibacter sp.]
MITLYEFNGLSENDKGEEVFNSSFLGNREEGGIKVQLYSLEDFYVEVYYDPVNNRILRFRAFKRLHILAPFIKI